MEPDDSQSPITLVLVEDHQMVAEGMIATLGAQPDIHVVGMASTAAEALERIRVTKPSVVLMDHRLPDGDGTEVAATLKAELPETKFVMLTASEDDAVLLRAIEAGCSGYLTKGTSVQSLIDAVRSAHAGEALISSSMLARLLPKLRPTYRRLGADITPRERDVLRHLATGASTADLASDLNISVATARNHVQNILNKLGAHSKLEAVSVAVREGIVEYPS